MPRKNFRWALWIACGSLLLMFDPLRHVLYDAQFNPAACGPPGRLLSREAFYSWQPFCRMGQLLGNATGL